MRLRSGSMEQCVWDVEVVVERATSAFSLECSAIAPLSCERLNLSASRERMVSGGVDVLSGVGGSAVV